QVSGPTVLLSAAQSAMPTFTAPSVGQSGATLVFQLVVNDGLDNSAPAQVTITVLHVNQAPVCTLAQASPAVLWPPNHKLVAVTVVGVTDAANHPVTLTVTGVTQDEPTHGLGDGDTSPDAALQGGKLLLRAERAGGGAGRLYQVSFTASDSLGGQCTGVVTV